MSVANISSELLAVAKVITAPNVEAAGEVIKSRFSDVDADISVLEAALKIAGVFFAPAAQAEADIEIAVALYKILKLLPPSQETEAHYRQRMLDQGSLAERIGGES